MKALRHIFPKLLASSLVFSTLCSIAAADDDYYPLPADFSTSVVIGKKLKNPFAAKLRLNQAKVKDVMNATKVTDNLGDKVALGTTMYFGPSSKRNRAIIDGKVRRPGDAIEAAERSENAPSLHLLEIRRDSVVLSLTGNGQRESVVIFSEGRRHRPG